MSLIAEKIPPPYWMDTDPVLMRANHWMWLACNHPASAPFMALVSALLDHTYETMVGARPKPTDTPQSLAEVAATSRNAQAANAREHINSLLDQLLTVATLASWAFGDGQPRDQMALDDYPLAVRLRAAVAVPPTPQHSDIPQLDTMSEAERRAMTQDAVWTAIRMAVMRAYHGSPKQGAVIGAVFFALCLYVEEVRAHVDGQWADEGVPEADRTVAVEYLRTEMRALSLMPMTFDNAALLWESWWLSITDTVRSMDTNRMGQAMAARSLAAQHSHDKVKEGTAKKRTANAAAKMRRRALPPAAIEAAAQRDAIKWANDADDDDDDDDDLDGLLTLTVNPGPSK